VLINDELRGWKLGKPRKLRISNYSDAWLQGRNRKPEEIINEFIIERLKSIWRIGGKYSVGMGGISIEVTGPQVMEV